jgi:hypothetical protein
MPPCRAVQELAKIKPIKRAKGAAPTERPAQNPGVAAVAPGGKRTDDSMVGQGSVETGGIGDGSAMDAMSTADGL